MAKGGSSTTQTQEVTQQTQVTVQNVIEGPKLDPLEKVKLLGDLFAELDRVQIEKQKALTPGTVILQPQASPFAFLADPKTLLMITAAGVGLILVAKRVK